ncbi:3-alpha,7-alpha,12-alpha-trihydroxy-5-beta-cholest-24-enoyl-CoA hydratase [Arcanobacterium haemolyticum]|uniref:3-alpha,7-alpha, 12-alpha-trihydroxy-5-beta-cholest-24-enoyl-CoA hydratase n=1 Tax=Arcanobacterium haemolyticum (strain ATCC 9345 / DSM 20595 / CCM 5947 / CCUG 17215 / LMG 16163 / NBRC 15585 / NCTC 8452 / 11018) TaxID=644284 RepID=D7BK82_ARCHD|nr:MaoC/PaaZ C-terminal domain-containing protein [Arcanobacterium haemolyticum]ADH93062.1 3-alpha,7-alpha,12-alpha-trihydroxy-5-beta-cholest-24-enoyl-CoA hydratase [Arcanobacterium haemolyticum DSM 20595]QCX47126.1 3-alpha,7-alpha,12-alpha-trihydroxy-5-beta-cholest-24-enoyl-CoA hydratase [Arcanobacterium haemolyticum]SQH28180.1 MaoC like domain [Arcanobacterium haemolyticum]
MAINTDMVGQTFGPFVREYTFRDLELFALGCGAGIDGKDGLEYLDERDERNPQLKVLPMFGAMLIVDSEVTRTIDYGYNYAGSLHWGFDITFHQPITKLNDRVETMVKLDGLYDRGEGRGLLAKHIGDTYDSDGQLLFTNESWDCLIYDGGWGGPAAPKDIVDMPEREPDVVVEERIPENQALIYRLSGDYHPQHINWEYAAENGEPRPILHAISYAGVVMRHAINSYMPGEPERIKRFKTRITSPVHPGTTLRTELWQVAPGELRFRLVDADAAETGAKPHLNWGIIEFE